MMFVNLIYIMTTETELTNELKKQKKVPNVNSFLNDDIELHFLWGKLLILFVFLRIFLLRQSL